MAKALEQMTPEEMSIDDMKKFLSKPPQEILAYAKKRVGMKTDTVPGRYPVEYDPIRRYCHMLNDDNPLYLDTDYAKKAGFKDVVCPPLLVGYFAGAGIWPVSTNSAQGVAAIPRMPIQYAPESPRSDINMATEYEFFKPVIVGDRLSSFTRVGDPYIKAIKRDPEAIWFVTERVITNQKKEEVCLVKTIMVGWRREVK